MDKINLKILGTSKKDILAWHVLLDSFPLNQRDIHFLPEYGKIYEKTYKHKFKLAVFKTNDGTILFPFSIRPLNDLSFLKNQNVRKKYFDIGVSYGYGGPVFKSTSPELLFLKFKKEFNKYCVRKNIAAEFTLVNPFLNGITILSQCNISLSKRKDVIFLNLNNTVENLYKDLNKGNKSNINKAKRAGVKVFTVNINKANLAIFEELYYKTMSRHKADQRWVFPKGYFKNCSKYLGKLRTSLHFAKIGRRVIAAYFLIHDFSIAYYHFAGSDEKYFNLRPSNLLMWETILWAKRAGYTIFHLGGGVSSDSEDSLLRYKSGFSNSRTVVYSYQEIHNKKRYLELSNLKIKYEKDDLGQEINSDYFPLYRR